MEKSACEADKILIKEFQNGARKNEYARPLHWTLPGCQPQRGVSLTIDLSSHPSQTAADVYNEQSFK